MKSFISKIKFNRYSLAATASILLLVLVILIWPSIVRADPNKDISDFVTHIVGLIVSGFVWILGKILIVLINLVIWVATYNDFINAPAVSNGWGILRDICNMFFILILLIIAFMTTLNQENYGMKKLLPRFILAAILVNFSKLICGVIIDFAQVVMMTFVNGFRDIGGGNLADMLGITKLLSVSTSACGGELTVTNVMGTYVLALLYVIVATAVITIILFVLVMRMVMIWIYVVLSPMAWLTSVLPATKDVSNQWWKQFGEAVVSGPILAFFIWLSFASAQIGSSGGSLLSNTPPPSAGTNEKTGYMDQTAAACAGASEAGTSDGMLKFVISIGLLIGGLMITKQVGGAVGSMAGKVQGRMQKVANKAKDWSLNQVKAGAKAGAKNTGKFAARQGIGLAGFATGKTGNILSRASGGKIGGSLQSGGKFMKDWRQDLVETKNKKKYEKRKKTLEKFGMKERSMDSLEQFQKTPLAKAGKGLALAGAGLVTGNPWLMAGGAATAIGMASAKWLGGKTKNFASSWEKNRNVKQTEDLANDEDKAMTQERITGHDKLFTDHDTKIKSLDSSEKTELDVKKKENEEQIELAKGSNYSDAEIEKIEKANQASLDTIADGYNKLREKAEYSYNEALATLDSDIDKKYSGKTTGVQKHHEEAQETINRDNKIKGVDKKRDDSLKNVDEREKEALKQIKNNFKGSPMARNTEINRAKSEFQKERDNVNSDHKNDLGSIRKQYGDLPLEVDQLHHATNKTINWAGNKAQKYEPNKLTIEAAKLGTKEYASARSVLDVLNRGDFDQLNNRNFSKPEGLGGEHEKLFELLMSKEKDSKDALENILKSLKNLSTKTGGVGKPNGLSDVQNKMLIGLKRGLAHFMDKKPGSEATFMTIVNQLNGMGNIEDGNKKVSDYKPKKKT